MDPFIDLDDFPDAEVETHITMSDDERSGAEDAYFDLMDQVAADEAEEGED